MDEKDIDFRIYSLRGKMYFLDSRNNMGFEIKNPYTIIKIFRNLVYHSLTTGVKLFDNMLDNDLKSNLTKLFEENKIRMKEENER